MQPARDGEELAKRDLQLLPHRLRCERAAAQALGPQRQRLKRRIQLILERAHRGAIGAQQLVAHPAQPLVDAP
jgi:hypothetical protein